VEEVRREAERRRENAKSLCIPDLQNIVEVELLEGKKEEVWNSKDIGF